MSTKELEADEIIYDQRSVVYRAVVARSNFMAVDRPETQYATKECCRRMAGPTEESYKALKIIACFVSGKPRLVLRMDPQVLEQSAPMSCKSGQQVTHTSHAGRCSGIDVYCDSDWAGCPRTRKSTTGGCVKLGSHLIKCWSNIQAAISLSSGEAEHYAIVKAVGIGLGIQEFLRDMGVELLVHVHTDSVVAKGIAKRVGSGTQRHVAINTLWVQEKLRKKAFEFHKIRGKRTPQISLPSISLPRRCTSAWHSYPLNIERVVLRQHLRGRTTSGSSQIMANEIMMTI